MGCYDSILVPCPNCGERAEFQTKSGPCALQTVRLEDATSEMLLNVNRHAPIVCPRCAAPFLLRLDVKATPVIATPKEMQAKEENDAAFAEMLVQLAKTAKHKCPHCGFNNTDYGPEVTKGKCVMCFKEIPPK